MKETLLALLFFGLFHPLMAQYRYKITVKDAESKESLVGANLHIKNTETSLKTNTNGQIVINSKLDKLPMRVSMVGYRALDTTLYPQEGSDIVLELPYAYNMLQQVEVSTGYQQLPKERSTGSFASVSNKLFNQQVSTDVLSRLEAVTNGLMVDRGTGTQGQITIRGLSTITGPRDPLIVVNNFPYEGDINNINPNDVENITVLKDAAAASIWGARASNGVIVIKLKEGKLNQPINVGFTVNTSVSGKPDLSYIPQINSGDFIDLEKMLYEQGFYNSDINSNNKTVLSPVVELLHYRDMHPEANPQGINALIDTYRNYDIRDDFKRYVYQKAVNQQYALNMSSGSGNMNWMASLGYDHNVDQLEAGYSRLNFRLQHNMDLAKNLRFSSGVYFTRSKTSSGRSGYGDITQKNNAFLPYTQLADESGNPLAVPKIYRKSYIDTVGGGRLLDWAYYPLTDYLHTRTEAVASDLMINAGLDYSVFEGLKVGLKYQYEQQLSETDQLYDEASFFTRDFINRYTQIDDQGQVTNIVPYGGIKDNTHIQLHTHSFRGQVNYDKSWKRNELNLIAGSEWRNTNRLREGNRLYGYNDDILTWGTMDYVNRYPNFITGSLSYIPPNITVGENTENFISMFANAAYTFDRKYTLSFSARRDASNLFGLSTNDQWNPFWSAGLAWHLSEESFYPKGFPDIRLRSTIGYSGNIDAAMVAVTTMRYSVNSPYTGSPSAQFDNYYNPDLRWESSRMLNIGLDIKALDGRINGSVEYYRKYSFDLFGSAQIDYTAGVGNAITKNVANIQNKGIDIQLNTVNLNKAFRWESTLNYSFNRDKVLENYIRYPSASNYVGKDNIIPGVEGRSIYSIYSYKWGGLNPENGNPIGYLNGEPSEDYLTITGSGTSLEDLVYHGSAIPTSFGSFINSFSFKGFLLSFSIMYKLGYYFRRSSIHYSNLYSYWFGHSDYALRWQNPGDELRTNVPSAVYPANYARDAFYNGSEATVEKGDHIRLQFINLGYHISSQRLAKLHMKDLNVFLTASNLGILWRANDKGIDPDRNIGNYSMPVPATFSIGLRTNFF